MSEMKTKDWVKNQTMILYLEKHEEIREVFSRINRYEIQTGKDFVLLWQEGLAKPANYYTTDEGWLSEAGEDLYYCWMVNFKRGD